MLTMMRLLIAVTCLMAWQCHAAVVAPQDVAALRNERGLEVINGTNFYITPVGLYLTLDKATTICNDLNMRMVSLQTAEKDKMVADFVRSHGYGGQHYWTSGIRYFDDTFVWSGTGELVTWQNWGPGEPNELDQQNVCIVLNAGYDLRWDDADCDAQNVLMGALCEELASAAHIH